MEEIRIKTFSVRCIANVVYVSRFLIFHCTTIGLGRGCYMNIHTHMYIYIYIYINICIIYVYMYTYICILTYIHTNNSRLKSSKLLLNI